MWVHWSQTWNKSCLWGIFLYCRVARQRSTRAYPWHRVYVAVGGWKMEVRLLPPQQSSDKSILVTMSCILWMDLPTANLPSPTPIREENQAHYSGQLTNRLGVPCRYSWLIWPQSNDCAMSTQAACHSGGRERGGQLKISVRCVHACIHLYLLHNRR